MADGISIDIKGLAELKATFESLTKKDADRCVAKALMAGAEIEQAAIVGHANFRTTGGLLPEGALANDIEITRHRSKDGNSYITVGPGKYTSSVARWVEYGHRLVRGGYSRLLANGKTKGPGSQVATVPEHPFIRPAYEESRQAVADAIATTLNTEIVKAAAKGGKS
jgi:HK97 gp10 family phage protein